MNQFELLVKFAIEVSHEVERKGKAALYDLYARYQNLLITVSDTDDWEQQEVLRDKVEYIKSLIIDNQMSNKGYVYNDDGTYPKWIKE